MGKWDAIILTCPNKNSSVVLQQELKLRQQKGIISKESIIICIEDPEGPIGSGGATLNALLVIAETLSARQKHPVCRVEVLKDSYILILHMGRIYPFDIASKGFSTLPFQYKKTNHLLTNFDLIYDTISNQIAGLSDEIPKSDPGIYIGSTDMLFFISDLTEITIKNEQICVISCPTNKEIASKNGIYSLDKNGFVSNIYYQPNEELLKKCTGSQAHEPFNLISGIVYFNFKVAKTLFNLLLHDPLDACSYIGIDSGATPLCLSLFFDILLASCKDIKKEDFIVGSFKTNHNVPSNQKEILRQARITLWDSMQKYNIRNITIQSSNVMHVYMNSESSEHRKEIFLNLGRFQDINNKICNYEINNNIKCLNTLIEHSNILNNQENNILVNTYAANSDLKFTGHESVLLNSYFDSCKVEIGSNCYLTDLKWENKIVKIPENLFIQNVNLNFECLSSLINLNVVFGLNDNLTKCFNEEDWSLMNVKFSDLNSNTGIKSTDLWSSDLDNNKKTLLNAKLYPLVNSNLNKQEMDELSCFFWINLLNNPLSSNPILINNWRQSLRLSLEDIITIVNLEALFMHRRKVFNLINNKMLVRSVIDSKQIEFNSIIRNAIYDGYGNEILKLFDEAALKHSDDLILLPRIMMFISNTLCEMAIEYSSVRSGPNLNQNWIDAFQYIENGMIEKALVSLARERQNWLHRNDMLIRASRHYEGAMLAFIRQATSSFKSNSNELIRLEKVEEGFLNNLNWVEACSPARLDLAGAWSDTPPITYECSGGSCVTNVAILVNEKKPIGARASIFNKNSNDALIRIIMQNSSDDHDTADMLRFEFTNLNEFRDYNKPQSVACLMKAVCVFTKLVELENHQSLCEQLKKKINGSLELRTWTGLPHGSGLGTSSILIGCVLKVIWYFLGVTVSNETLSYSILIVEQLMTTNGGWQDQVGGIWGGFKLTTAKNKLPLEISVKQLELSQETLEAVNSRLILVYTGLTRLAKDLLLNVIRNWYAISDHIYENVRELVKNGLQCSRALEEGNIIEFGNCINKHRKQKLIMAPGSEPDSVKLLTERLEPYVHGMALAGAGGGGFLYILTKEPNSKEKINKLVKSLDLNMKLYDAKISNDGIEVRFG